MAAAKTKGRAIKATFEYDDGAWIYGVDVVQKNGTLKEVEIDATSGKLADVETITPAGEAQETQSELKHAMQGQ